MIDWIRRAVCSRVEAGGARGVGLGLLQSGVAESLSCFQRESQDDQTRLAEALYLDKHIDNVLFESSAQNQFRPPMSDDPPMLFRWIRGHVYCGSLK